MRRLAALAVLALPCFAGTLPLTFVSTDPGRFITRGAALGRAAQLETSAGVRIRFEGARDVPPLGRGLLDAKANIIHGSDPRSWKMGLPSYSRVEYKNVYPGVDVVYYGRESNLEFDLAIAAGAELHRVEMVFEGAPRLRIGASGQLIAGGLQLLAPDIGHYVLTGADRAVIRVPERDPAKPLRIDPQLIWSTYLGGNLVDDATAVAVDPAGNVYVAGLTTSNNFTTVNAVQPAYGSSTEVFVAKLSPGGDRLLYSTYLGGAGVDQALAIVVDAGGNAFITGSTGSGDFPLKSALQTTFRGGSGATDAFLTKLDPNGALVFSTFIGGTGDDFGRGIALDSAGNIYIGGETAATDFPVLTPAFPARGSRDGFVVKIPPAADRITYGTYIGGTGFDSVNAIAVDAGGAVYVAGQTRSADFPATAGSFQPNHNGGLDGFVAKLSAAGDQAIYASYFGTPGAEGLNGIAVDSTGAAHVTGVTDSGLPTRGGGFSPATGGTEAFAVRFNAAGSDYIYEQFLRGSADDRGSAVALDSAGNAYYAGETQSPNYPTLGLPPQPTFGGTQDAFLTKLDPNGGTVYSTYLGGALTDVARGVAVDASGIAYVVGVTKSINFPVTAGVIQNALRDTLSDSGDAFVARIGDLTPGIAVSLSPAAVTLGPGGTQQFTANTTVTWSLSPNVGAITASGLYTAPATIAAIATVTVRATSVADGTQSATAIVTLAPSTGPIAPVITLPGVVNGASFGRVALSPGLIFTLFGERMGPAVLSTLVIGADGKVANRVAGTRVLFDGVAAPLIYTSEGQVAGVVPYSVAGRSTAQLIVEYQGVASAAIAVPIAAAAPAIFTSNSRGTGQGAILNENTTFNGPANPAGVGSIVVIYATGEGETDPTGVDGLPSNAVFPRPRLPVTVTIGGRNADVLYAGAAPQLVAGVLQINARIPVGTLPGDAPLTFSVGGVSSPAGVTVAVR